MPEPAPTLANTSALSVTELSSALKRTLEDRFGYVRVRGEISGYRGPHISGHVYFSLKDEGARLEAVIWKTAFLKMRVKPQEGLEVVASGKLTTFAGKSSYQIIVDTIEPAGVGALMALLEARRRQLAGEGLFDAARKRPLPYLPTVVGVVTSPSGSVIRDILHRLADRFPVRVIVWPVRVQGETAAEEIAAAIAGFGLLTLDDPALPRPDVLIVARGGGSLEDLWSFNEEIVVRAAFASPIPLISAVGHETDWTLIDHVADVRAPTPTAAAEISTPVRSQLIARVGVAAARLTETMGRLALRNRSHLRSLLRALPSAAALVAAPRQRLDVASDGLTSRLRATLSADALAISNLARRHARHSPQVQLMRASERVRTAGARLNALGETRAAKAGLALARLHDRLTAFVRRDAERRKAVWEGKAARWAACGRLARRGTEERAMQVARVRLRLGAGTEAALEGKRRAVVNAGLLFSALNYKAVLARGYALVRDNSRAPVALAERARKLPLFTIQFADGELTASPARPRAPRRSKTKSADVEQERLF
jgi:exodeoxyribonuclease VII large subunit